MRRLQILLVTNSDCDADRAEHFLQRMGHGVTEVYDANWACEKIEDNFGTPRAFDAVIIDEFAIEEAEMIALNIRMKFEAIYIGIVSSEVRHRAVNGYANEVIPESFMMLKDALNNRFSEAI